MKGDLEYRLALQGRIDEIAGLINGWESAQRISESAKPEVYGRVHFFNHTKQIEDLVVAGVDGSGDFPSLAYNDCFVYLSIAQAVVYQSNAFSGLKEITPIPELVFDITWLPEKDGDRQRLLSESLERLAGISVNEMIESSDYRELKGGKKKFSTDELVRGLILPHASDSGNLAIQLRTVAELGAAWRLLNSETAPNILLFDGTLTLPFVNRDEPSSLFFEHLKRLCCKKALEKGTGFFALSKSHGLSGISELNEIIESKAAENGVETTDKWFVRLPLPKESIFSYSDDWTFGLLNGNSIPPKGAVSYLFQLHKQTRPMRLDMDRNYFEKKILATTEQETTENERKLFHQLDYISHDQRCYGYPYPIKAAHDRASLTKSERESFKQQLINAAIKKGVKPKLFTDASIITGHA